MEITNFEKVCTSYDNGARLKQACEKVYNALKESGKEMTATEIAESITNEFKYSPSVQFITACIYKLHKLDLVARREVITGKKITIDPKHTHGGYITRKVYREVFDEHGKSLGVQGIERKSQEPLEIDEKKALFSIKNA